MILKIYETVHMYSLKIAYPFQDKRYNISRRKKGIVLLYSEGLNLFMLRELGFDIGICPVPVNEKEHLIEIENIQIIYSCFI